MTLLPASAAQAAPRLATLPEPDVAAAASAFAAAGLLLPQLERGQRIDAALLRGVMEAAFGASDATGAWTWKTAYEACEAATVLFLRKYGGAMVGKGDDPAAALSRFARIAGLLPTQTRRTEEAGTFQQFSTPLPLGFAAATAAAITPADRVLEPSAGTGLLAILAEIQGAALLLNELATMRAGLLSCLFPALSVTRFDAAQIHDHLDPNLLPTVVLMNPPFSALAHVEGRVADAAARHIAAALARLAVGGRLVTLTGAGFAPDNPAWTTAWQRLQDHGRVVFTAAIDGSVYARHGTTVPTRLTVIDKRPAEDPAAFPASPGVAPDVATLIRWLTERLPVRLPVDPAAAVPAARFAARPARIRSGQGSVTRTATAERLFGRWPIGRVSEREGV